ncbi:MAG: oligosaccharide flippase family protein, partial [Parafilimonas sp.]
MVNKKQVVQSGVWQILNAAVKTLSQFAYYAVMARILPNAKVQLGIFAILNSFMNIGNILGDGGMGDALLQKREHDKQHVNAAFYSGLLISAILYVLLFIASPYIAVLYDEPGLNSSLRIFATVFIFGAMSSASLNLLQKNFKFKKIFLGDGIFLLLSNILGVVLALTGMNYMSLVYSQIFYFSAKFLLFVYYEPVPLKAGFTKKHWKEMVGYGSGLTLIRVNNYIANFGIVLEVGKLVSRALLGIFDRTYRIMNIPQRFLYDTVQRVMMPAMVKKMGGNKGVYNVFERTLSVMNTIIVPLTLFLILFSKPIVL